jgi:hypothetical protein
LKERLSGKDRWIISLINAVKVLKSFCMILENAGDIEVYIEQEAKKWN